MENRGYLGPPNTPGTVSEMRHLNRLIRWTREGLEYEADPRHVELVVDQLEVTRPVTTPLVKEKADAVDDKDEMLSPEDARSYRSCMMRIGYVSHDRTDLQRTVRELAKGMQAPTARHLTMLKRCARYLLHAPRMVQKFLRFKGFKHIDVYADTDHAGCTRTRKSTTGCVMTLGPCQLRSLCRGQAVIALSSAEAEYYGLVTCASEALGEQSMMRDFGMHVELTVHMDAIAALAIGSRRGLGKVKHLHTVFLWVQDLVTRGLVTLKKVHIKENLADLLTKPVDAGAIRHLMHKMNMHFQAGHAHNAYTVRSKGG